MLSKGQVVYWARIIDCIEYYEIIELKIRTVEDTWFVGCNKDTAQAYLFDNSELNKTVFIDRYSALCKVTEAESKHYND